MKHLRVSSAVAMIVLGTGYLIFSASTAQGIVYKTATEIRAEANPGRAYRLTGHAVSGSIERLASVPARVNFTVIDHDSVTMRATYAGVIPDTFKDRAEVVISGRYDPQKDLFVGAELLAKCPSKYQGKYDTTAVGYNPPTP